MCLCFSSVNLGRSLHSVVLIDVFVFFQCKSRSLHSMVLIDVFVFFQCKSRSHCILWF